MLTGIATFSSLRVGVSNTAMRGAGLAVRGCSTHLRGMDPASSASCACIPGLQCLACPCCAFYARACALSGHLRFMPAQEELGKTLQAMCKLPLEECMAALQSCGGNLDETALLLLKKHPELARAGLGAAADSLAAAGSPGATVAGPRGTKRRRSSRPSAPGLLEIVTGAATAQDAEPASPRDTSSAADPPRSLPHAAVMSAAAEADAGAVEGLWQAPAALAVAQSLLVHLGTPDQGGGGIGSVPVQASAAILAGLTAFLRSWLAAGEAARDTEEVATVSGACLEALALPSLDATLRVEDGFSLPVRALHQVLLKVVLPAWDPTMHSAASGPSGHAGVKAQPGSKDAPKPSQGGQAPLAAAQAAVQATSLAVSQALRRVPACLEQLTPDDADIAQLVQACVAAVCTEVAKGQRSSADACHAVHTAAVGILGHVYSRHPSSRVSIIDELLHAIPRTLHGTGKGSAKRSWKLGMPMLSPGELLPPTAQHLRTLPAVPEYHGTLAAVQTSTALLVACLQACDAAPTNGALDAAILDQCATEAGALALRDAWAPQPLQQIVRHASGAMAASADVVAADSEEEDALPIAQLHALSPASDAVPTATAGAAHSLQDDNHTEAAPSIPTPAPPTPLSAAHAGDSAATGPVRHFIRELLSRVLTSASMSKAEKSKAGWADTSWASIARFLVTDVCILVGHPRFPAALTLLQLLLKACSSTLPTHASDETLAHLSPVQPVTVQLLGTMLTRMALVQASIDALPLRLGATTEPVAGSGPAPLSLSHSRTATGASAATARSSALLPFTVHTHAAALSAWAEGCEGSVWTATAAGITPQPGAAGCEDAAWLVQAALRAAMAQPLAQSAHRDRSGLAAARMWFSWWQAAAQAEGNLVLADLWASALADLQHQVVAMSAASRPDSMSTKLALRLGMQAAAGTAAFSSFEKLLVQLLAAMARGSGGTRKRALDALRQLVQVDPALLRRPAVRSAMRARLADRAISVRAATVELLGQYVLQDPSLLPTYADVLLAKLQDSGLSVRKSAVSTLQRLLLSGECAKLPAPAGQGSLETSVLRAMLRRLADEDEEESLQDLITSTVDALWFAPVKLATALPPAEQDETLASAMEARARQMVALASSAPSSGATLLSPPAWLAVALRRAMSEAAAKETPSKRRRGKQRASSMSALEDCAVPALRERDGAGALVAVRGLAKLTWSLRRMLAALATAAAESLVREPEWDGEAAADEGRRRMQHVCALAAVLQALAAVVPQAVVPHIRLLVQHVSLALPLPQDMQEACEASALSQLFALQKAVATRTCCTLSSTLPHLAMSDTALTARLQQALSQVVEVRQRPLILPSAALLQAAAAAWGCLVSQAMAEVPEAGKLAPAQRPDGVLRVQLWTWWRQCRKMREVLDNRVPNVDDVPVWLASFQTQSPWTYSRVAVALYGMGLLVRGYDFDAVPVEDSSPGSSTLTSPTGTAATPTTLEQAAAVESAFADMPIGTAAALVVDEYSVWSDVPHAHLAVQATRGMGFVLCRHPGLLSEELFSNILQESLLPSVHPDVRAAALTAIGDVLGAREEAALAGQGVHQRVAALRGLAAGESVDTTLSIAKAEAAAALRGSIAPKHAVDHSVIPAFVRKCLPLVRSALCTGSCPGEKPGAGEGLHAVTAAEAGRVRAAAVALLCGVSERGVIHSEQVLPALLAACGDPSWRVRGPATQAVLALARSKPRKVRSALAEGLFGACVVHRAATPTARAASPLLAAAASTAAQGGARMRVACDTVYTAAVAGTPSARHTFFRRVLRRFDVGAGLSGTVLSRSSTDVSFSDGLGAGDEDLEAWADDIAAAGGDRLAEGMRCAAAYPLGSSTQAADVPHAATAAVERGVILDVASLQYAALLLTCLPFTKVQEPAALVHIATGLVSRRADAAAEALQLWVDGQPSTPVTRPLPAEPGVIAAFCELVCMEVLLRMIVNVRVMYDLRSSSIASLTSTSVTKAGEAPATVPPFSAPPLKPMAVPKVLDRAAGGHPGLTLQEATGHLSAFSGLLSAAAAEAPALPEEAGRSNGACAAATLADALHGTAVGEGGGLGGSGRGKGKGRKRGRPKKSAAPSPPEGAETPGKGKPSTRRSAKKPRGRPRRKQASSEDDDSDYTE